jgi:serine/threonine protein kinase
VLERIPPWIETANPFLFYACPSDFVKLAPSDWSEIQCIEPDVDVEGTLPMIGKTLGHYQITSQLGKGGMGEVYQAKDQKLGRDVAIKVLPEEFAKDADRVARFQREAKLLASLNHPNIAAIYGLEKAEGKPFLVLELVDGETLAQRIGKGQLSVEEALGVCRQIAEGLEAAHEKGVIHRDLKPANVMITEGDKIKILDFGLAKALSDETQSIDSSQSPTLTEAMTRPGIILGTAAYMSPEQAKGKSVDKRADIWAFGCILYECLTGKRPFEGETVTETLAAILRGEPDWQALPANVPPNIGLVLRHTLERDMNKRFRDASDARMLIEAAASYPGILQRDSISIWNSLRRALPIGVLSLILVSAATGFIVWRVKPSSDTKSISRLSVNLPPGQRWWNQFPLLALSPDGTNLAYVALQVGKRQIYLRRMDSFDVTPITGTEQAIGPFFSPDGRWLGFYTSSKLMKVSVQGGNPLPLADAASIVVTGASWGERGTIILAPAYGVNGLTQVSETGGSLNPVATKDSASDALRWPQFLPGGRAILFTAWKRNVEDARIMVRSLKTGEEKILVEGGMDGRYVPTGHLVYARRGNLYAVPFDLERLEVRGSPGPVLQGVRQSTEGVAHYAFSNQGTLAYIRGSAGGTEERDLAWVDRSGKEQSLGVPWRQYFDPCLSPDGKRIALVIQGVDDEIWTYDISDRKFNRLTFQGRNLSPVWTPDGKRIVFRSDRGGNGRLNLFWLPADGSSGAERLTVSDYNDAPCAFSPDGRSLIFARRSPTKDDDLWILPFGSKGKPYPLLETRFFEGYATFSPDGQWFAYVSNESGQHEVYIRRFPGPGGVWQVSTDGGTHPTWARNGELFFRTGDKMMAVEVQTTPAFKAGNPRMIFEAKFAFSDIAAHDVTLDGKLFLIVKPSEKDQAPAQIQVVLNWFEELKRKVPAGRK